MLDVLRLTLGNGQSYEGVSILTASELRGQGVKLIFGDNTFCFVHRGKFIMAHAYNILVVHLTKLIKPVLEDSIPYEKVVLSHDAVYGPGQIYLPKHAVMFGLEPITLSERDFVPFLFSAENEGLLLVDEKAIATLECKAACATLPTRRMTPQLLH